MHIAFEELKVRAHPHNSLCVVVVVVVFTQGRLFVDQLAFLHSNPFILYLIGVAGPGDLPQAD
jgi:hypothetical protein